MRAIAARGAVPVIVQHRAMHGLAAPELAALYDRIAAGADRALAFELGPMFAPHGAIWDDETFDRLLDVERLAGAKHSSLDRGTELRRLAARDRRRPGFRLYTGNDLAIDMVCYGSDYLLGLSAFAPEAFAERDRRWAAGDRSFHELNDLLQYLGFFAFRPPVPAYRHDAALFLSLRGRIGGDATPAGAPRRPASDRDVLADIADAARRGVDVRIIAPGKAPIAPPVNWVGRAHLEDVVAAGGRAWETPGTIHRKAIIADDETILSSYNLTKRSASHDHEVGVRTKDPAFVQAIEGLLANDIASSRAFDPATFDGIPAALGRIFAKHVSY